MNYSQVFSLNVGTVMSMYKEKDARLIDSESTIAFIKRINKLIVAMTFRSPNEALKLYTENYKVRNASVTTFISFSNVSVTFRFILRWNNETETVTHFPGK